MQKIITNLWYEDQAEEAVNFYIDAFGDGTIGSILRYDEASAKVSGRPKGSVLTVDFELFGQRFTAINGGPAFEFTPAISLLVNCETQEELDGYWERLSADPKSEQCGWLKDKYGVSWQIVPRRLQELLESEDEAAASRVMAAMLKMHKLDLGVLEAAAEGK